MLDLDELKKIISKTGEGSCTNQCPMINITDYLIQVLQNPIHGLGSEGHADHHDWIQLQIDKERRRIERKQKIIDGVKQQVIGWSIIAFIGALLTSISAFGYRLYVLMKP